MKVYLDNSSTTPLREEVIEEIKKDLYENYGNPSSLHRLGLDAEKKMNSCRNYIGNILNVDKDEIFFTSGGTESNNIGIQGYLSKFKSENIHIITSKIEHSSVLNIFKKYEECKNVEVSYIDIDKDGVFDLDQFRNEIKDNTKLVSVMLVNNETGSIQPIKLIKNIIREKSKHAFLHVDGVQGFGKLEIDLKDLGIDIFSFSAHKIHGPKGVGGIFIKRNTKINPLFLGGNQEKKIRSGTENTIGISGLNKAIREMETNKEKERKYIHKLKNYFIDKVKKEIDMISVNSKESENFLSNIVNISFLHTKGEILLHSLEQSGIYVSTASACTSKGSSKSYVLKAIGLKEEEIEGAIRFSFSHMNTKEDIDYTVAELKKAVEEIRSIMMR